MYQFFKSCLVFADEGLINWKLQTNSSSFMPVGSLMSFPSPSWCDDWWYLEFPFFLCSHFLESFCNSRSICPQTIPDMYWEFYVWRHKNLTRSADKADYYWEKIPVKMSVLIFRIIRNRINYLEVLIFRTSLLSHL